MKIEIFGKENCSFCSKAQELLTSKDIEYLYQDFYELTESLKENVMTRAQTAKTFPIILIDDVYVGGYTDIAAVI